MQLPESFCQSTRLLMGDERFDCFVKALDEPSPVSIRLNPLKPLPVGPALQPSPDVPLSALLSSQLSVPWCRQGYYLPLRPGFTFDPLLHAGCYYVQEASSMFVDHVLRQFVTEPVCMLDLCAAPGGKSTAARAALPEGSVLVSNEPVRMRASVLLENVVKWGWPDCVVTNNNPKDFRRARTRFDVILCDVPCSGEGMFRKDPQVVAEWSPQHVEHCWQLQRDIVGEAWQCLNEGGLFIYSTCTYNIKENEANVLWMQKELGAEVVPVDVRPEWNITGSLLKDADIPVCRFIPGFTKGEGLFMAVMRKGHAHRTLAQALPAKEGSCRKLLKTIEKELKVLSSPLPYREEPCNDVVERLVELSYQQAIAYLRGESVVLPPDVPRGLLTVAFKGMPLGPVKNIGNRANNLYPKEWRIKSTHIPQAYETIFRLA